MTFQVSPLTPHAGAQIRGGDLGKPLAPPVVEKIYRALIDHWVVLVRDQALTPQAHVRFSALFSELGRLHPVYPQVAGCAEIARLENHAGRRRTPTNGTPALVAAAIRRSLRWCLPSMFPRSAATPCGRA